MEVKKNSEFDTLNIYVKKSKSNEIIDSYKTFGWQLKSESENNQYEDIVDLAFEREHKIKNKDELQLLQVYMEDKLNEMGKLEKNKNPKTTAFGLFFGVTGIALIVFGALFGFKVLLGINLGLSIGMSFIGIIFLILTIIFIPKLSKKELNYFNSRHSQLMSDVKEIKQKAASLFGGDKNE